MTASRAHMTAAIKGEEAYVWFLYTGPSLHAANDKGRTLSLEKGDKFGVRKSANLKSIRLITQEGGPNKVFTCDAEMAALLAKRCKPTKA